MILLAQFPLAMAASAGVNDAQPVQAAFMLTRHGVRVPSSFNFVPFLSEEAQEAIRTKAPDSGFLAATADQNASFAKHFRAPGGQGHLAAASLQCQHQIGEFFADRYNVTAEEMFVYADYGVIRDNETARAFVSGVPNPNGGEVVIHANNQFLLEEGQTGRLFPGCDRANLTEAQQSEVLGHDDVNHWARERYAKQFALLQRATGHDFASTRIQWIAPDGGPGGEYSTFNGSISDACKFSDFFTVEAAAGVPEDEAVWHALGLEFGDLVPLREVCDGYFRLYKNRFNLAAFGLEFPIHLLSAIEVALKKSNRSAAPSVIHPEDSKFLTYFDHDVAVDFLRMVMRTEYNYPKWQLPYDADPYDVRIIVEVLGGEEGAPHPGDGARVRAFVFAPSLQQQHDSCGKEPISDDNVHYLDMPHCSGFDRATMTCPYTSFFYMVGAVLDRAVGRGEAENHTCLDPATAAWWHHRYQPGRELLSVLI